MRFLERDQAAGELEEREVVLGFLRPADQKATIAVEPGVARLDDPADQPMQSPDSAVGAEEHSGLLDLLAACVIADHDGSLSMRAEMRARYGKDDDVTNWPCADDVAVAELKRHASDRCAALTDDEHVAADRLDTLDLQPRAGRNHLLAS